MTAGTALQRDTYRDDFAALLEESFLQHEITEGSVVKGRVVAIEKDVAVIDIGAKTEGRVALKEFNGPGREGELAVGDEVQPWMRQFLRVDPAELHRVDSPGALRGTPREMADQLLRRRDELGVTYYAVGENFVDALAPVVELLAGRG